MTVSLTALYVPGDRPERIDKALASGADVVIVDLEDAVAPASKADARDGLAVLGSRLGEDGPSVQVRVNAMGSAWFADDLAALADLPAEAAVRVPKVESAAEIR